MHRTTDRFWQRYWSLPKDVQSLADKNFQLLKANPTASVASIEEGRRLLVGQSRPCAPRVGG